MTDSTPFTPPPRQALEAVNRSAPGKVTGRLRAALLDMVWIGSRRDDAAKANGMSVHGLREALRKPHVKAFYLGELGVLRESERPKTFHRLCDLRDQDENKNAAVAAAKALEQISDEQMMRPNATATPGICLRLVTITQSPVDTKVIDVTPQGELAPEAEPVQRFDPIFRVP
jgi:hypothetical protein